MIVVRDICIIIIAVRDICIIIIVVRDICWAMPSLEKSRVALHFFLLEIVAKLRSVWNL